MKEIDAGKEKSHHDYSQILRMNTLKNEASRNYRTSESIYIYLHDTRFLEINIYQLN